jgi:hypothetical protein
MEATVKDGGAATTFIPAVARELKRLLFDNGAIRAVETRRFRMVASKPSA